MTCLITGATSELGIALMNILARHNYDLIGIGDDAAKARATAQDLVKFSDHVAFIIADIAKPAEISTIIENIEQPIDLLIHCGSCNELSAFEQLEPEARDHIVNVNLQTPILLTQGLLQAQLLKQASTIVFFASLTCFTTYSIATPFAASKDGLAAYARNLSIALAPQKIQVLTVYPAAINDPNTNTPTPYLGRKMRPEQMAQSIFAAIQTRRNQSTPGIGNAAITFFGHYLPTFAKKIMQYHLTRKFKPSK